MLCAPQESEPVCSYLCAFSKCAAYAEIGVGSAGCTPLHLAMRVDGNSSIESVRTLVQAAPKDVLITDACGHPPPRIMLFSGYP